MYLDGGIRRGTDVFKALARGAKAVFIGRPSLWGLVYKVLSWHSCVIMNRGDPYAPANNLIYLNVVF